MRFLIGKDIRFDKMRTNEEANIPDTTVKERWGIQSVVGILILNQVVFVENGELEI